MVDSEHSAVSREAIGERLRITREAIGLTLTEFAKKSGIGKTRYENFEAGRNLIKPDVTLLIIRAFPEYKIDFNWVYHGNPDGLALKLAEKLPLEKYGRVVA